MNSNIKMGYPNPNFTEEDIGLEPIEMNAQILIDDKDYRELVDKAAAMDILTADLKAKIDYGCISYELIDEKLVLAVTGMGAYKRKKEWEGRQKSKEDTEDGQA